MTGVRNEGWVGKAMLKVQPLSHGAAEAAEARSPEGQTVLLPPRETHSPPPSQGDTDPGETGDVIRFHLPAPRPEPLAWTRQWLTFHQIFALPLHIFSMEALFPTSKPGRQVCRSTSAVSTG